MIETKRIEANASDGEKIPITLIYNRKIKKNRRNKLLLHGYGSYGMDMEVNYNIVYLSALENDWILAFAHIRGGSEKGIDWHEVLIFSLFFF